MVQKLTAITLPSSPKSGGRNDEEEPRIGGEEQDLEDRVEGDEPGDVLVVAARQLVPDQHHGDAAGKPDQDHARHVLRVVAQEDHGEREHQHRADDPVLDERQRQHAPVLEDEVQLLVAHLRQRRVHHQDQADRDRHVGGADREGVEGRGQRGERRAEQDAERHRGEDPERQPAVEEREPGGGARDGHGRLLLSRRGRRRRRRPARRPPWRRRRAAAATDRGPPPTDRTGQTSPAALSQT